MYIVAVTNASGFHAYLNSVFEITEDKEMAHRLDRKELDTFLASAAMCHLGYSVTAYATAS